MSAGAAAPPAPPDTEPQAPEGQGDVPADAPAGKGPMDNYLSAELHIDGDDQLSLEVGGKAPTSSTFHLRGRKIDVEGIVKKGTTLRLEIEVYVGEVTHADKVDEATGQPIACARRHYGRITGLRRLDG